MCVCVRETDRQTDRQTDRDRQTETESERQRERVPPSTLLSRIFSHLHVMTAVSISKKPNSAPMSPNSRRPLAAACSKQTSCRHIFTTTGSIGNGNERFTIVVNCSAARKRFRQFRNAANTYPECCKKLPGMLQKPTRNAAKTYP